MFYTVIMKAINLIYVGSLIPRKGVLSLIVGVLIWNLFKRPKKKLVICGTGVLEPLVVFIAKFVKNISFKGYQSRSSISKFLLESDLFVMLSKREAFGLVYVEALMHRVPVAMLRDESISIFIEKKNMGLVLDDRSYKSLRHLFSSEIPSIDQKKLNDLNNVFSRDSVLKTYEELL